MNGTSIRVVHILHRLEVGGMETVLVELLNRLPAQTFQHTVICLTDCAPAVRQRVTRSGVVFHALHTGAGHDWSTWRRVAGLLREIRPQVVHTLNLAALEMALPAWWTGVPIRVHAEHGRDIYDLAGENRKYRWWRRVAGLWVTAFVPVSRELERWLIAGVGIAPAKVRRIANGVDLTRFTPAVGGRAPLFTPDGRPWPGRDDAWVIGTVGRLSAVKDHANLLRAFARLLASSPPAALQPWLVVVGEGPERAGLTDLAVQLGIAGRVWWAGERADVPELLRGLDLFVLPSLAEGTPLTVLEAMAAGLPVVATEVGGVPDLVAEEESGLLVMPEDAEALARAMARYLAAPGLARRHGAVGRQRVEREGGVAHMVDGYTALFLELLMQQG